MNKRIIAVTAILSLFTGAAAMYGYTSLFNEQSTGTKVVWPSSNVSDAELEKIQQVQQLIEAKYVGKVDEQQLTEGAIQGMLNVLKDPYSTYMDKKAAEQFTQSLDSSFQGIGAEVSLEDGKLTIVAPIKNSPAERAGLKPKDHILSVNGESLDGLDLHSAVNKIRGKKGTTATLVIDRAGVSKPLTIEVVRDDIPIETVYSKTKTMNGKTVGVLQITSFSAETGEEFTKQLAELEAKNIAGLVIDVRGNPGGYLEAAKTIINQFVTKEKPMYQVENREGQRDKAFSTLTKEKPYKVAVLIDGGSASASEILAGALHEGADYPLIGEKSFGKGTVQSTIPLTDGSEVKLTIYKWLTPDGNWIHKKGIQPSLPVKQPDYYYASPLNVKQPETFDMNNETIKNAQIMLRGLGYNPGRVDGYFNKATEAAVRAFQQKQNLPATGAIDAKTATVLQVKILEAIRMDSNDMQLHRALKEVAK